MNTTADPSRLTVDLVIEDPAWTGLSERIEALVTAAARAAHARMPGSPIGAVAVTLADDETLRALNAEWRGKDKPTNVLSFPAGDSLGPGGPIFLGDIILARETITAEAREQGKIVESHLTHLVIHGMLHLLGLDHETPEEAERMEALEREILLGFGIPDPYLLSPTYPEPTS